MSKTPRIDMLKRAKAAEEELRTERELHTHTKVEAQKNLEQYKGSLNKLVKLIEERDITIRNMAFEASLCKEAFDEKTQPVLFHFKEFIDSNPELREKLAPPVQKLNPEEDLPVPQPLELSTDPAPEESSQSSLEQ